MGLIFLLEGCSDARKVSGGTALLLLSACVTGLGLFMMWIGRESERRRRERRRLHGGEPERKAGFGENTMRAGLFIAIVGLYLLVRGCSYEPLTPIGAIVVLIGALTAALGKVVMWVRGEPKPQGRQDKAPQEDRSTASPIAHNAQEPRDQRT
jgi:hypothetical protein